MKISKQDIEHVAVLARIKISEKELEQFSRQLSEIIDYVERLDSASTENINLIEQISGLANVARADKISDSLEIGKILQNAPEKEGNFIKVKKVFE